MPLRIALNACQGILKTTWKAPLRRKTGWISINLRCHSTDFGPGGAASDDEARTSFKGGEKGVEVSAPSAAATSGKGRLNILFCGSDAFSAASLKAILDSTDLWQHIRVLTSQSFPGHPDPKGTRLPRSVMESYAWQSHLVFRTLLAEAELKAERVPPAGIEAWKFPTLFSNASDDNVLITASFGHILPDSFLARFKPQNRLNVHPSLLPNYRGAAPIQWTIAHGDKTTGVTVQSLVGRRKGIDCGAILGTRGHITVPEDATYHRMLPVLAEAGGEVLVDVLRRTIKGEIEPRNQATTSEIRRAPKIRVSTAHVKFFEQTAQELDRLSRGIEHQAPLWTTMGATKLKLYHARETTDRLKRDPFPNAPPGSASWDQAKNRLIIRCKPYERGKECSLLAVSEVQQEGRNRLGIQDWWNGLHKNVRRWKIIRFGDYPAVEDELT